MKNQFLRAPIFILAIFFSILCFKQSFAHEVNEAIINEIINSGEKYTVKNVAENIQILKRIDSLSQSIGYAEGMVYANLGLTVSYNGAEPEISERYILVLDSLNRYDPGCFTDTTKIQYYLFKGSNRGDFGDEIGELNYYLKADSLGSSTQNEFLLKDVNYYISMYYFRLKDYNKALTYNNKLIRYFEKGNNPQDEFYLLLSMRNRGEFHLKMEKPDSAIFYVKSAVDKGLGNYTNLAFSHFLLGKSYLHKGDLEQAVIYGDLCKSNLSQSSLAVSVPAHDFLGDLSIELGKMNDAQIYYQIALEHSNSIQDKRWQKETSYKLLRLGLLVENNTIALQNLERYKSISDSLNDYDTKRLKHQLLIQYETGKKELEISELKYQGQVNQKVKAYIIFSSITLILLAVLIIYRTRSKRKLLAQKLVNSELDKQTIQVELNQTIAKIKEKVITINELKADLDAGKQSTESIDRMTEILNRSYLDENNWTKLIYYYDQLNNGFTKKVKQRFERITKNDLQLLILVKLSYSNREIATIKNITESGVKKGKQRLLQKLELKEFSGLNV